MYDDNLHAEHLKYIEERIIKFEAHEVRIDFCTISNNLFPIGN